MRLIDAELTAKEIAKFRAFALECGNDEMNKMMEGYNPSAFSVGFDYGMELAQKVVGSQPTAYDTDKVVEQLEKRKDICKERRVRSEGGAMKYHYEGEEIALFEAIEIVKGGVSDEESKG